MLVIKGLKVFAELSTEYCKDYSKLKAALLNAYSVVSEVHRSRFRNRMKQPTETYSDFAFALGIHCKRWLQAEQAYDNFERTRERIKLEQLYERMYKDLHSWLWDKNPKTLTDSAKLADEYNAVRKTHMKTHKTQFQSHIPKTRQINGNAPVSAAVNKTHGSNTTDQPHTNTHETSNATSRNTDKYSRMICHY